MGDGSTGRVAFDAMGDRMFAEYEIINIQCHESRSGGYSRGCRGYGDFTKMNVGSYQYSKVTSILHFLQCAVEPGFRSLEFGVGFGVLTCFRALSTGN